MLHPRCSPQPFFPAIASMFVHQPSHEMDRQPRIGDISPQHLESLRAGRFPLLASVHTVCHVFQRVVTSELQFTI